MKTVDVIDTIIAVGIIIAVVVFISLCVWGIFSTT